MNTENNHIAFITNQPSPFHFLLRHYSHGGTLREKTTANAKRVHVGGGTNGVTGWTQHRYGLFRNEKSNLTVATLYLMFVIVVIVVATSVTARRTVATATHCRCGRRRRRRRRRRGGGIESDAQFDIAARQSLVSVVCLLEPGDNPGLNRGRFDWTEARRG
jgi:hypothetical protein